MASSSTCVCVTNESRERYVIECVAAASGHYGHYGQRRTAYG